MKIGAAVYRSGPIEHAVEDVVRRSLEPLGGARPDIALLFASNHFEDELPSVVARIRAQTRVPVLIGCTGEGIIGPDAEVERDPAVSLWLAHMPGVEVQSFYLEQADLEVVETSEAFARLVGGRPESTPTFILLADPFSFHMVGFLEAMNDHFPGALVVGGMASGVDAPRQTVLLYNDTTYREGAVGLALTGNVAIDAVVSQGCRPIGTPFVITAAEQNIMKQLGGKPALSVLNNVFAHADTEEKKLMQQGIFVGQVIDEYKESFGRGDFLVRNLLGADQQSGAIAIGDYARVGRTIQFHVRDAKTADEDLRAMLSARTDAAPAGALLFSCNGRGTRLFSAANHDLNTMQELVGRVPIAGFFCAGEFGPVGGRNFIHGHTASIALFRPKADETDPEQPGGAA